MNQFEIVERVPSVEDYQKLRSAVGWGLCDPESTAKALTNSLYAVSALHENEVIGCGRVIGDAGIYYYIQDIIVLPEFHGRGVGRMIMDAVMRFLEKHACANSFLGLMAAKDVAGFYEKYGFARRPPERPGMFRVVGS